MTKLQNEDLRLRSSVQTFFCSDQGRKMQSSILPMSPVSKTLRKCYLSNTEIDKKKSFKKICETNL